MNDVYDIYGWMMCMISMDNDVNKIYGWMMCMISMDNDVYDIYGWIMVCYLWMNDAYDIYGWMIFIMSMDEWCVWYSWMNVMFLISKDERWKDYMLV